MIDATAPASPAPQATAAAPASAVPPVSAPAAVASPSPAQADNARVAAAAPGSAVPVSDVANVTPAAVAADPRAEINALATELGYDPAQFAQFADVTAARAAVRFETEQLASLGLQGMPQQQPAAPFAQPFNSFAPAQPFGQYAAPPAAPAAPAAPVAPAAPFALDLKTLGLDEDEPAAKAIRILETKLGETGGIAAAVVARLEKFEQAQHAATAQKVQAEAASVVDAFASPTFGVSGKRTTLQQMALQKLYDVADAVLIGAVRANRPAPTVAQRLARARHIVETEAGIAPVVPVVNTPALRTASPAAGGGAPEMSMTDRWAENPALMARIGAT